MNIEKFINKYIDMINVKHSIIECNNQLVKDEFDISIKEKYIGRIKFHIIIKLECNEYLVTEFKLIKESIDDNHILVVYHDFFEEEMKFDDFVSIVITHKQSFF